MGDLQDKGKRSNFALLGEGMWRQFVTKTKLNTFQNFEIQVFGACYIIMQLCYKGEIEGRQYNLVQGERSQNTIFFFFFF